MRKLLRAFCVLLVLLSSHVPALPQAPAPRYFPVKDLMLVGTYYYPEHWPESQWERDFANMERLGFEFVHMGAFAWAFMEPEEGRFDSAWLDRAVALAAKHNLKVILCTPTPTPPAWLAEKYPSTFLVGEDGRRREHGSRGNNALADADYLRLTERVVNELGRRYGRNTAVWGWQLDNEPNSPPDYGPAAAAGAFRDRLRAKYRTVDVLNQEWGSAFWSLKYNDFDQVRPPNPSSLYGVSPHAMLDFRRFTADQTAKFLNWQASVLRRNTAPAQKLVRKWTRYAEAGGPSRPDRAHGAEASERLAPGGAVGRARPPAHRRRSLLLRPADGERQRRGLDERREPFVERMGRRAEAF